jgi:hypothetical protein
MADALKKAAVVALASAALAKKHAVAGRDGRDAPSVTPEELVEAARSYFADKLESFKGADGKDGRNGRDGVDGVGRDGVDGRDGVSRDGADGVGVDRFEQLSETNAKVVLTDGREFHFDLPEGKRGLRGSRGERGADGVSIVGEQGEQGEIGPMPKHKWEGTKLRFEISPGEWGKAVDLQGPKGRSGQVMVGGLPENRKGQGFLGDPLVLEISEQFAGNLSGDVLEIDLSAINLGSVTSIKLVNPEGFEVSVVSKISGNTLQFFSNVPLDRHKLLLE